MNRNPLIPFALIAILGIVLTVVVSFWGLNNADKMLAAQEQGGQAPTEEAAPAADDPEGMFKASCASCHGQNLEGGVGPDLTQVGGRLSADEIANVINNGKNAMPPGIVDAEKAGKIAAWLAEKK